MSKKDPQGPPSRRMRGFEAAGGLLRNRIRAAGEKRGFAVSRLLTHWAEVVGEETAGLCRPVKIGYARDGFGATLTLLTTGAAAPMLQMQLPQIRYKVNACYGYNAIARISLTQTAPTGFAEGQAQFTPKPKSKPSAPDPRIVEKAQAQVADCGDADLKSALEQLARNVLSRSEERARQKKG